MPIPFSVPSLALPDKIAIVTGGGTGIGLSIALEFAKAGAAVVVAGRTVARLEKAAAGVRSLGRRALAIQTDVSQKSDVDRMVAGTMDAFGRIDVLVNNAGMAAPPGMPFTNNTEEDWDRAFAVNTKSVFLTCKAVAPYFIERKAGRIINIASIAGPLSAITMPAYSVAKQGVITFTRILAKELAPHGITVNAICPGVLWTDFWQRLAAHIAATNPAFAGMTARQVFDKRVGDIIPMKCEQHPEDIGWAAVFLASDEARYITGVNLMVKPQGRAKHSTEDIPTGNSAMPASGIAYAADLILTADHVIEREEDITVILADGTEVPARLAGRDAAVPAPPKPAAPVVAAERRTYDGGPAVARPLDPAADRAPLGSPGDVGHDAPHPLGGGVDDQSSSSEDSPDTAQSTPADALRSRG